MWSAISKIFAKNSSNNSVQSGEDTTSEMERRKTDMDETFHSRLVSDDTFFNLSTFFS